jgi:hypothetical protein
MPWFAIWWFHVMVICLCNSIYERYCLMEYSHYGISGKASQCYCPLYKEILVAVIMHLPSFCQMWCVTQELSARHCWPVFIILIHLLNRPLAWPQLPILKHVPAPVQPFISATLQSSKYFCHIWCASPPWDLKTWLGSTCNTFTICEYFATTFLLLRVPNLLGDSFFSTALSASFEDVWHDIVRLWEQ